MFNNNEPRRIRPRAPRVMPQAPTPKAAISAGASDKDGAFDIAACKVKSLAKALGLFDYFSLQSPELGITELAARSGLLKSSVHNMVRTLCACGFLEKNEISGKYKPGMKILQLSHLVYQSHDLRNLMRPFMERVSKVTGENVYLGTQSGEEVLYIDAVAPPGSYSARYILGVKAPLYCTGIGKALLAYLPQENVNAILTKGLLPFTPYTLCDPARLQVELEVTRIRGYSVDDMEHEYGIKCVAIPIKNAGGKVVAAMSISGPSLRFTEASIKTWAKLLLSVQKEIMPLLER